MVVRRNWLRDCLWGTTAPILEEAQRVGDQRLAR